MTTKQEKSDRSSTDPVINQKVEYFLGLSEVEATILRTSLDLSLSTGNMITAKDLIIHKILAKLSRSLEISNESSDDLSLQQQNKELRHRLQEYRKKLNDLEDRIDELEVEVLV